jgi:hypothetical protein
MKATANKAGTITESPSSKRYKICNILVNKFVAYFLAIAFKRLFVNKLTYILNYKSLILTGIKDLIFYII